ncbi:MAG: biotin--[acetyl-CoA-carboxylase] ligase [Odoribacteraceae bacterium]|jgi:BirA family biotin operon repressor/biotin-[acetyl-CoA-carboxylase] ligase|nr:biotin--[acetyl-CoA-carboxylase] ligase [Odoribacteraceae bacterium]
MYLLNGFKIREFLELESTNSETWRLAEELEDRSVIITPHQTQGRGNDGNTWESEPGKNISMTILLRPVGLLASEQFILSMLVALGTLDFVARHVPGATIKWPNDIYVDDRKIAGILIEHMVHRDTIHLSLCGVGLNVNQARFISDAPNPVSLYQLLGREIPLRQALAQLLEAIGARLDAPRDYPATRVEYTSRLYRGTGIYPWKDNWGRFRASIRGVNKYGQLLLDDETGRQRVYGFKEVRYVL